MSKDGKVHVDAHDRSAPGPSDEVVHVKAYDRAREGEGEAGQTDPPPPACKMWKDGNHLFEAGALVGAHFEPTVNDLATMKRCICGETVELGAPA